MGNVSFNVAKDEMVMQDKANVVLTIEVKDSTRLNVQKALREKADELFTILRKEQKVESYTQGQNINAHYVLQNKKHVQEGFIGRFSIGLISYDFDALNALVEQVGDKAEVTNIHTSVSTKVFKQKEADLTREAIALFKEKALLVAQSFGYNDYTLGEVSVSSTEGEYGARAVMASASFMAGASMESASSTPEPSFYIEPKQERIQVRVNGSVILNHDK